MSQQEDTCDQLRIEAQENPDQAGFLQEATTISSDYQARLHPVLKERLKGEVFFDVHAHCFNHRQVPNNFLRTRMNTPYDIMGTWFVKGLAKVVGLFSPNVAILSIAAYRKPELIAQTLIKCYHKVFKVSKQPDRHVVVVMLSLNMALGKEFVSLFCHTKCRRW